MEFLSKIKIWLNSSNNLETSHIGVLALIILEILIARNMDTFGRNENKQFEYLNT